MTSKAFFDALLLRHPRDELVALDIVYFCGFLGPGRDRPTEVRYLDGD